MNWNVAQTVTVSAAQDTDAVDDTATIEHAVEGGDYGANSVTADDVAITVDDDELPPALALSVNAIATDDIINILEKGAGFSISGDTGSEGGAAVTVTLGSTELTATSADADPAIWSVNVAPDATYITGTSVAVSVTASKIGFTSPSALERSLTVDLAAPTAPGYTAPTSLQVGVAITAMSPNGGADIDEYSATDLPSGLILDPGTGAISGTPGTANNSTTSATVTVRDAAGNTATVSISFPAVTKGDQALSGFAYSASSATYGSTAPSVIAPTGVQTTLSYSATPAEVCTVDSANGALTLVGAGSCVITATAAATANYNEAAVDFTVTVQAAGTLVLNLDPIATDNTINIAEKAAGFSISGDTGVLGGVNVTVTLGNTELTSISADTNPATWSVSVPPNALYITGTSVTVTVNAAKTGYSSPAATTRALAVDLAAPTAPTYTAPSSLKVGEAIESMSASGDSGIDEYSATGLPSGLDIDSSNGLISGTPNTANANTTSASVTVGDTAGNTALVSITFPAVDKGDQTLTGFEYSASSVVFGTPAPSVTPPSGVRTTLSYSATPASVCTVAPTTGLLTLLDAGICEITAEAAGSANYNAASTNYAVSVQPTSALALNFDAIAGDNVINIAEQTAGFTINGDTGTESGVEVRVQVGSETLTTTSADNAGTGTWSVRVPAVASYITGPSLVVEVNASKTGHSAAVAVRRTLTVDLTAPTAPGYAVPASLQVGEAISAMNPNGGVGIEEYDATGLPSGLTLNTSSGVIDGTPDTADSSTTSVSVTVSDAAGNTDTVSITFPAVDKGDQTLSGFQYSASSATYGSTVPSVIAPTGVQTTLSYSATPAEVCTVDSANGALTLVGAGACVITATAAATANYNEAAVDFTVSVQAAGALVLNLQTIAGDNAINIAEKATGFSIDGDTGTESGVAVSVLIGTETLSATSADVAGTARWSVSVPAAAPYITGASLAVEVNAAKTGYSSPAANSRTLTVDLVAPTAPGYTAPASLQVGAAISPMSPSGGSDIGEYSTADLPSGLSIDDTSGEISGTPDTANASTASATVTVSDAAGNTDTVSITFPAVDKGDQTLSGFQYGPASVTFGSGTVPGVTAPTGVLTTLSYSATPAEVCTVDSANGALTLVGAGSCVITATAAATANYNEAAVDFTVSVQAAGALVLNLQTIAGDNAINIAEKATGFSIDGDTGTESGVAVSVLIGTETLSATSADVAGTARWSVSVPAAAPYITGASVTVTVNAAKTGYSSPAANSRTLTVDLVAPTAATYTAPASLQVGAAISPMSPTGGVDIDQYAATNLPPGLDMNTNSGEISGTPDTANASTADAQVTVSDAAGNTDTVSITFPEVDKGDQTLSGFQYGPASVTFGSGTVPGLTPPSGAENDLSYSATPAEVCTVDSANGALTLVGAGACVITATAAATANYNEAAVDFTVSVQAAGALVLNLQTIAGDNAINIAEKATGFSIDGDTGTESGVAVSVLIGTETLSATSADVAGTARWSVSVPAAAPYITGASLTVTVNAAKTGYSSPAANSRTLTVDLVAPTAPTYTVPASLQVGAAISPMSPSGGSDIGEYSTADLPSGLSIDDTSGEISGTPDTANASTASATVTVSDAAGNTDTVSITFPAVDKGDQTLSGFQYGPASVTFGSGTVPGVTAPTGVLTTLSYSATPAEVCTVDSANGALTLVGAGACVITATAAATANYNEAAVDFTVSVQAAGALVLNLQTIAGDNAINIAEKATGFSIDGDTGTESGVAVSVLIGTETLSATSADVAGTARWSVSVPAAAPYITGASLAVEVNAAKTGYSSPAANSRTLTVDLVAPTAPTYTVPASLQVGAAISPMSPSGGADIDEYGVADLPSGLSIDTNGEISGTPDTANANTATATVTVSDAAGNTAEVSISFPAVGKGDQTLSGFQYSASTVTLGSTTVPSVTAPSGALTSLSYSATPASVCTVDISSGALTLVGAGSCLITATAAATTNYNEATAPFTITVQPAGALSLNLDAISGDNAINIAEKAAGFIISGDTGTETDVDVSLQIGTGTLNTTSADDAGTATWSVSVPADATYITGTSVTVTVNASKTDYTAPAAINRTLTVDLVVPTAPTYTVPASLQVGEAISPMSPSGGADIDGYDAADLPSGLAIDTSGVISGTPDTANASTASATVTVSDAAGNTAEVQITFPAVDKGDQTLSGFEYSPASVNYGSNTVPGVTAPTGVQTTLSYSATPAEVCTVDSANGALTLVGAGACVITATAAATANYNEAAVDFTVSVQAAGALVLNLQTIAGDNAINIAEKATGFSIDGDTGTESGVAVSVLIGTETLSATSADVAGTARWSVSVPAAAPYITGASLAVEVNAAKTGYSSPAANSRTLTVDLVAPTAPGYTAPASLQVGAAISPMSPSGGSDIGEYSTADLPSGLSIDDTSGEISGTPDTANASTASATVTVSDAAGNTDTVSITFPAVDKGDQTLSGFQYGPASVTFGSGTVPGVTAPTGVLTTLSYSATPAEVCTVDSANGALTLVGAGSCVITATAAATANYNEAAVDFTVSVQAAGALVLNLQTIAGDNAINIAEKATGFSIDGDTGTESGVAVSVLIGTETLSATSADVAGTARWSVSVPAAAPYITGASLAVEVNAAKTGYSSPAATTRALTVDLVAPTAPGYTVPASLQVGAAISPMSPSGGSRHRRVQPPRTCRRGWSIDEFG